jgi:uncharacterized membrane protein YqjE
MENTAEQPSGHPGANGSAAPETGPAREMSLHLLRMVETRIEAAGIVLQAESNRMVTRLRLQVLGGAAIFIAIWGGIVLLAIALPPNLRVPVLSGVVAAFALAAAWAFIKANRMVSGDGVGSLNWFLASLKLDLEVLSRSLAQHQAAQRAEQQSEPRPESTQ